jgi:hypothetical protein
MEAKPQDRLRGRAFLERAPRLPFGKEVFVSSFGSSQKYKAFCDNISNSGYLIQGDHLPFQRGSLVELHLEGAPFLKKMKFPGKVARVDMKPESMGYGIQLSLLDPEDLNLWKEFVALYAQKDH